LIDAVDDFIDLGEDAKKYLLSSKKSTPIRGRRLLKKSHQVPEKREPVAPPKREPISPPNVRITKRNT
jgi:hypothetical protein